jgi:curved DNA-binding protein CbpA
VDDPHKVLGIEPGATAEQIGQAYRALVRRFPPELNPERFARIHGAYELLRSSARAMEEVRRAPEAALDALFPAPQLALRPLDAAPEPLEPQDLEPLLRPLRRALLERLLRESLSGPGS